jgi:hypothetical protein
MPPNSFLHERSDFKALVETVADSEKINDPAGGQPIDCRPVARCDPHCIGDPVNATGTEDARLGHSITISHAEKGGTLAMAGTTITTTIAITTTTTLGGCRRRRLCRCWWCCYC